MNQSSESFMKLEDPLYIAAEVIVAIFAVIGNFIVVYAFFNDKKLRRLTNYYVVSLAFADFLIGLLGIPFAIMSSIGLPRNFKACLCTNSFLVILCTISIFNLFAVSVDRYWAIIHPMKYSIYMHGNTAIGIIIGCWILGTFYGLIPLLGWHGPYTNNCGFTLVMDYNFLAFLYFSTIVGPCIFMGFFYGRIYFVVLHHLNRMASVPGQIHTTEEVAGYIRVNRKEVNSAKILFIIVSFFVICWIPLYTINTIEAFCKGCKAPGWLLNITIILSHANSAINPLLYAYHLRDFRRALKTMTYSCRNQPTVNSQSVPI